jgi:hypothetical protein
MALEKHRQVLQNVTTMQMSNINKILTKSSRIMHPEQNGSRQVLQKGWEEGSRVRCRTF